MKKAVPILITIIAVFAVYGMTQKSAGDNDIPDGNICGHHDLAVFYLNKNAGNRKKLLNFTRRHMNDCRVAVLNTQLYTGSGKDIGDPCGVAMSHLANETSMYATMLWTINDKAAAIKEIEEFLKFFNSGQYCTFKSSTRERLIDSELEFMQEQLEALRK